MYYTPTKIDYEGMKFLIMSAPVDTLMHEVVRVIFLEICLTTLGLKEKWGDNDSENLRKNL